MGEWIRSTPIWLLGVLLLAASIACAYAGWGFSRWLMKARGDEAELTDSRQGYVVSSVFALLALMLAFTFSLAMDRYQARKQLVVEEAVAIEGLYLKAQLLPEPGRSRISDLLVRHAETISSSLNWAVTTPMLKDWCPKTTISCETCGRRRCPRSSR